MKITKLKLRAYFRKIAFDFTKTLKELIDEPNSKTRFWRKNRFHEMYTASEYLQKIVRGILRLINDFEETGEIVKGIIKDSNIGFASGKYDFPIIINWEGGEPCEDRAIYYRELREIISHIASEHQMSDTPEVVHFVLCLDDVITSPLDEEKKSILRSHMFLCDVGDRIQFIYSLHKKTEVLSFAPLVGYFSGRSPKTNFINHDIILGTLHHTNPIFKRIREVYSFDPHAAGRDALIRNNKDLQKQNLNFPPTTLYTRNDFRELLNFMRNVLEHERDTKKGFFEGELIDALDYLCPSCLCQMVKVLHQVGALGKI